MDFQDVNSSQISSVGYDVKTRTLAVKFRNGSHYEYADVPPGTMEQMLKAESIGSHFHQHIRGKYAHEKQGI